MNKLAKIGKIRLSVILALAMVAGLLPQPALAAESASYTVEFTYCEKQYVMNGDSKVPLADILETVGLSGTVTAVEVSDSTLFSASDESGEWVVIAHQAFHTEEWLRVTIDGKEYEIAVTDANTYTGTIPCSNIAVGDTIKKGCKVTDIQTAWDYDTNSLIYGNIPSGSFTYSFGTWTAGSDYSVTSADTSSIWVRKITSVDPTYTAPVEKNVTYDGSAQTLISAGSVTEGGTMEYASGENGSSAPDSGWSTSIPTSTNAGTYYIWWRINEAEGYNALNASCLTSTIEKKEIGLTWGNTKFTYNGSEQVPTATATELVDGDTCTVTVTGGQTNIGSYTATASSLSNNNYALPNENTKSFSIEKKDATITAKNQSVVLNETISSDASKATLTGAVSGHTLDSVTLTGSGTNAVTTSGTITPSNAVIKSGDTDVTENYNIDYVNGMLTVTKAAPTYNAPTAKNELTYDGSYQELINAGSTSDGKMEYSLDGTDYTENVSDIKEKDAGSYTVWYKVIGDENHENTNPVKITVTIAKKPIKISGIKIQDKEYDATTTATLIYTDVTYEGIVSGDSLTVTATGSFTDAVADNNKNVTISNLTLGGDSVENYTLANTGQQDTATGKITKRSVTVKAIDQRVEVGGNINDGVGQATLTGALTGHTLVSVDLNSSDTSIITDRGTITPTNATIKDAGGNDVTQNYAITYENGTLTVIKARAKVTTTPSAIRNLVYNGSEQDLITAGATNDGTIVYALGNSEIATSGWNESVPKGKVAGEYYVWYRAAGDSNHSDSDLGDPIIVTIAKKPLTIVRVIADDKIYDGTPSATAALEVEGIVGSDDVTGRAGGQFTDANVGTNKTASFSVYWPEGEDASNYRIDDPDTERKSTATISKRKITIKALDQTVNVGGSISRGPNQVKVDIDTPMAAGQIITAITLTSTGTGSTTTAGTITPSDAVIKANGVDVTAYYEISYSDGRLTVRNQSSSSSSSSGGRSSSSSSRSSGSQTSSGGSGGSSGGSGGSGSSSGGSSNSGAVNYNELSAKLTSAISVINNQKATLGAAGVTQQVVTWDKGTSLPYSAMKTLQDNPNVTLVFKTTYGGMNYTFTIPGSIARANPLVPWYGPLYLLANYGQYAVATPAMGNAAIPATGSIQLPTLGNITIATPGGSQMPATGTYTVVKGDTLIKIASRFNTTVKKLVENNGIKNQNLIFPGQVLKY